MSPLCWRLVEEDMCFDFDEQWTHVVAWDDHPAYREGMKKVDGCKAVDFIGIHCSGTVFFIEAKDYRPHRAPEGREKPDDPWVELEQKVRSTVAALVGAHRQKRYDEVCTPIITALIERRPLKVGYWFDEAPHSRILETNAEQRRRAGASVHMQNFKKYLKWLDARIFQTSWRDDYEKVLPGVRARSLPRDLAERSKLVVVMLAERGMEVPVEVQRQLAAWVRNGGPKQRKQIDRCLELAPFVSSARQIVEQRG